MAHYKVYTTYVNADTSLSVSGAAYTAVPGGNNDAGTPWSEVVVGWTTLRNRRLGDGGGGTTATSPVPQVIQDQLDAGTLFEWRWRTDIPSGLTGPQARTAIEAAVNAQEAAMIADLSAFLRYWGFEGDS